MQRALRAEALDGGTPVASGSARAVALLFNLVGWAVWTVVCHRNATLAARYPWPARLPPFLGGNPVAFTAILTASGCILQALWITQWRRSPLHREVLHDTLPQLKLMPLPEELWLWMTTARPAARAMLAFRVGLPFFLLAACGGGWSLWDVAGLLLIFVSLGQVVPSYLPLSWQRVATRERCRQSRSGHDRVWPPDRVTTSGAVATEAPRDQGGDPSPAISLLSLGPLLNVVVVVTTVATLGMLWLVTSAPVARRGPGDEALARHLLASLPGPLAVLAPAFPLTWPVLLARLLLTPLPFLAFALPPVVLWLPLAVAGRYRGFLAVAARVAESPAFWTPARQQRMGIAGTIVRGSLLLLAIGTSWRCLMIQGTLGSLTWGAARTSEWAMSSAWSLALAAGCLQARRAARDAFARAATGEQGIGAAAGAALAAMLRPHIMLIAGYLVCCRLGGLSGVGAVWSERLLPTIATAGAFSLEAFASNALRAALPPRPRVVWQVARWLWCYGLLVEVCTRVVGGALGEHPFALRQAPHVVLSPYVSLGLLFRQPLPEAGGAVAWWLGPLFQTGVAVCCLAVVAAGSVWSRLPHRTAGPGESTASPRLWQAVLDLPGRCARRILSLARRIGYGFQQVDAAILRRAARYDNPVLTAQLRSQARSASSGLMLVMCLVLGGVIVLVSLASRSQDTPLRVYGYQVVLVGLAAAWFFLTLGTLGFLSAFHHERASGALVFLFLTPMTDAAILAGKLVPGLLSGLIFLATLLPWLALGGVVATLDGDLYPLLVGGCGVIAVFSCFTWGACLMLSYAARPQDSAGAGGGPLGILSFIADALLLPAVGGSLGPPALCIGLLIATVAHVVLAYHYWWAAAGFLRRQRYGDVTLTGKVIAN